MRRSLARINSIPLLFAFLIILSYGLLVPFTGFYWDDWPFAWIANFLGPAEFIPAFASFRPFLAPIFLFTTSLIPPVPLLWQIFALIIRFLLTLSAWLLFKSMWPDRPAAALSASLLMLVFPGYSQHWVALTHINQELIPLIFYLLSFYFTVKAVRCHVAQTQATMEAPASNQGCFFRSTLIAILLQLFGLFPTEYFFGIEILRFLFIYFLLSTPGFWEHSWRAIRIWFPYLLIWILNGAWLLFYYNSGRYASYEAVGTQTPSLLQLLLDLLDTFWKTGFYIWMQIVALLRENPISPTSLLSLGLILISFIIIFKYFLRNMLAEVRDRHFAIQLLIIGTVGILVGRLPSLAAGLPLRLQSSYDRFMVSMFIGGSLFVLGLMELLIVNKRIKAGALALLVALGVGQQFFNGNIFRRDWEKQGQIYWQLAWRIPALKSNTLLLTHQMPIDYETDLSFTAPINWIFARDYSGGDLPYALLYTEKRLGGTTLPDLDPGIGVEVNYRTVKFHGSTSQVVVIYMPPGGCLRVLDPARGDLMLYEKESHYLVQAIPLSDPSRIILDPDQPVRPIFFPEPDHDWCYFYTQAELERQRGDWKKIISLWLEADHSGFSASDQMEYLPFIEAMARTSAWDQAESLTMDALARAPSAGKSLCQLWNRLLLDTEPGSESQARSISILSALSCSP